MIEDIEDLVVSLPTFDGRPFDDPVDREERPDFGEPMVPVLLQFGSGIRIVMGSADLDDEEKPDLLIERKRHGWMIAMHPDGNADPCGIVYIRDDGSSFLVPDSLDGNRIEVLDPGDRAPGINDPSDD